MSVVCAQCREALVDEQVETRRYSAGGLERAILHGVKVGRCPNCGAETLSIPRIAQLHRVLAAALASKPGRLAPDEARFLRKYLGLSTTDLAAYMGVAPETVSRWESPKSRQPIGAPTERLLRLMALRDQPVEDYPLERLGEIRDDFGPETWRLDADAGGWRLAV